MGLSRKNLGTTLLFGGLNPHVLRERPTNLLRIQYQQKHCQAGLKGTEIG